MSTIQQLAEELLKKAGEANGTGELPINMENCRDLFQVFYDLPAASDFDDLVERTKGTMARLSYGQAGSSVNDPVQKAAVNANATLLDIESVADELDEWRGLAASSFRDHVKTPFPAVVNNMFIVASVIHGAAAAEQEIWRRVNHDVEDIFRQAINAVEHSDDCNPKAFVMTVGVALTVAGAVVAGPASAAGLIAVGSAPSFFDNARQISTGTDPISIVGNVLDALETVISDVQQSEKKVEDALKGAYNWMHGSTASDYRLKKLPTLAEHPGGLTGMK